MLNEETLKQLIDMKLRGMAAGFAEFIDRKEHDDLSFEEHFAIIVEREYSERQERRLKYRLNQAKLRQNACVEDINYRHPRGLDRSVMLRMVACLWIKAFENLIITGKTGLGKTWIACALAHKACLEGYTTLYKRIPRLLNEIYVARADGTYPKFMERLAKPDLLILDDFGLALMTDTERRDLLEVVEDRQGRRSTIITSQLKVKHWHEIIGDPTIADAIMDRLVSSSHRIDLDGDSLRPKRKQNNK